MFTGQLACEAFNFALKRLIKEERPRGQMTLGKGYGMPSSHAQFVAFWAVYLGLFLMVRHSPRLVSPTSGGGSGNRSMTATSTTTPTTGMNAAVWGSFLERLGTSFLAMAIAVAVAWSRLYLGYHSLHQVVVGWCAGVVFALAWFFVTAFTRKMGLFGWALELPLSRMFRIRDLAVTEDPPQAGWDKWEALRTEKMGKKF